MTWEELGEGVNVVPMAFPSNFRDDAVDWALVHRPHTKEVLPLVVFEQQFRQHPLSA